MTKFGPITGEPEFWQMWGWCWNINKNISFHVRLLPRKTNDKIFLKNKKNPILGPCGHFGLFCRNLDFLNFSGKKILSVFKYSHYLPSFQKSEKTNMPFLRKMLNWRLDGQTDRRTDRQPWFCRTLFRMGIQLLK